MSDADIFRNRETTSFAISVGTGLALESVFNPTSERIDSERAIPNKVSPNDYKYHVFNVHTLARNILSSTGKNKNNVLLSKEIIDVLEREILIIKLLYDDLDVKPLLYAPDYRKVFAKYNVGKMNILRVPWLNHVNTAKIISDINSTMDTLTINNSSSEEVSGNMLILTNYIVDLLPSTILPKVSLLESHTGIVKNRLNWGSKLNRVGKDLVEHIPITPETIYIFGDSMISKSLPNKIKKKVLAISLGKRWTPLTTRDKVRSDLSNFDETVNILVAFNRL